MLEQHNSFGYWLKRRRKALDLTQEALALKVSCSQAAIRKIEADERRPSKALAQRLADQLAVPSPERAVFLQGARAPRMPDHQPLNALPIASLHTCADEQKSPFVGRSKEYEQFLGLIARLATHSGQVVLIEGEAGIGKSRLMREVAGFARQQGLPVLATNCYEIERAIAYQPLIDLATQACKVVSEAQLRQIAPILLAEITALVPAIADRLVDLPPLSADFPEARQARLFHALQKLFDALAQDRPVIVMVDDAQWADEASLRFLHYFARQIASRPVLLVCAYRGEEVENNTGLAQLLESLRREPQMRHMALARLGAGDTAALLERLNDPKLNAPDLAAWLHRETDGNPFFLWSIMHALREEECAIDPASNVSNLPLPDTLRDSVRLRLARVPAEYRPLLDVAAVLGRRFDFETLLALTPETEERFLQAVDSLVKRRLLHEDAKGGVYDFNHDKVREVVYRDIGLARRVLLHRAVAEMLEEHTDGEAHQRDARLAEHFERGKVWSKALRYLGLAAAQAQKLFAMRESLQWFDRAVALLQAHPDAADPAQQLALYEQRGEARAQAGQIEGAVADFRRVIDDARGRGDYGQARDSLIQLGMAYRRADAYEPATACLNEALEASRAMGDEQQAADALYHLGTVAWSNGRNDLATGHHQQAVEICERLALTNLVAVQAFHGRGEAHFANGEPDAAIASFSRSLELARGIGDKSYESENLMMIGWACNGVMGLADYPRAVSHFDTALSIARDADLQWHLGPTLIGRANVKVALGQYGEAWADLNEALPRLETLGLRRYQIMAHDALGCLFLDLNQPVQALEHFEHGLELAHHAGIGYWLSRLQGDQAMAQLKVGLACNQAGLQAALNDAKAHSEVWLTVRCLEALAESALARGDARACITFADQLLALASRGNLREMIGIAHRMSGLAHLMLRAYATARQALMLAVAQAELIGRIHLAWACQRALAKVAAALKDEGARLKCESRAHSLVNRLVDGLGESGLAFNQDGPALSNQARHEPQD